MDTFIKDFVDTIYKNQNGYVPMIPLGSTVKLGDLLLLRGEGRRGIEYMGNIADPTIGVPISESTDETGSDQSWAGNKGVSWAFKAAGSAPIVGSALSEAEAGLTINFATDRAFFFEPLGIRYKRIENIVQVRGQLLKKLTSGQFDSREVWLVKHVASVDSYALAISVSKRGSLEIGVKSAVSALGLSDLARIDLGFSLKRSVDLGFKEIGARGGSLFFKAEKMELKKDLPLETRSLLAATPGLRNDDPLVDLPHQVLRSRLVKREITFRDMTMEDLTGLADV